MAVRAMCLCSPALRHQVCMVQAIAALQVHKLCYWLKVSRVDATPRLTHVVYLKAVGDRLDKDRVRYAVRAAHSAPYLHIGVILIIGAAGPYPALARDFDLGEQLTCD